MWFNLKIFVFFLSLIFLQKWFVYTYFFKIQTIKALKKVFTHDFWNYMTLIEKHFNEFGLHFKYQREIFQNF